MARRGDAHEGPLLARELSCGWGVELQPGEWLGPKGSQHEPFWWAKRADAERLAIAHAGLGRSPRLLHCVRVRLCTAETLEPWQEGFDPVKHTPKCGAGVEWRAETNKTAERLRVQRERAEVLLRKRAAAADAAKRREQARKAKERKRVQNPYQGMSYGEGMLRALTRIYKARNDRMTDEDMMAVGHVLREHPHAADENGLYASTPSGDRHLSLGWVQDAMCEVAEQHTDDPAVIRAVERMMPGQCRRALAMRAKKKAEQQAQKKRERARAPKKPRAAKPSGNTRARKKTGRGRATA